MNNEQRDFLVTKIDKYNKQIDDLDGGMTIKVVEAGLSVAIMLCGVGLMSQGYIQYIVGAGVTILSSFAAVNDIKNIISAVSEKAGLSNRINEIEDQLELNKLDTGKGM